MNPVRLEVLNGGRAATRGWARVGSKRLAVPLDHDEQAGVLRVPPDVLARLPLAPGQAVGLWISPDRRTFHLGPLLGLPVHDLGRENRLLSPEEEVVAQAAVNACMLPVFFSPALVPAGAGEMPAIALTGGRWTRRTMPLPDVVYNRGLARRLEPSAEDLTALETMQAVANIPCVNRVSLFPELVVCQALQFFAATRHLVPEARPFDGAAALESMLAVHARILAGPERPAGEGTQILCETAGNQIRALIPGVTGWRFYRGAAELCADLETRRGDSQPWVIRQAISPLPVNGRCFFLWAVLQKDHSAEWQPPRVHVRWTDCRPFVTNPYEPDDTPLPRFLDRFGHRTGHGRPLAAVVAEMALLGVHALEARFGRLGEVGLTVALDERARLWLLEADAQPRYSPWSVSPPLEYARTLAVKAWTAHHEAIDPLFASLGEVYDGRDHSLEDALPPEGAGPAPRTVARRRRRRPRALSRR